MHQRKAFFLFNIIISCLILFFPIYEVLLNHKIAHFICFDICTFRNFFIYMFIFFINSNVLYLHMDDARIIYVEKSFKKFRRLNAINSILDYTYIFYFFKLKFNEFLCFVRILFKNKILYFYCIYVQNNFLNIFVMNVWYPLFRRISYFGMYSTYFFKKNKNIYNNF